MSLIDTVRKKYVSAISQTAITDNTTSGSYGSLKIVNLRNIDPNSMHQMRAPVLEAREIRQMRAKGQVPPDFVAMTNCIHCGFVPIWEGSPPTVEGCPWCFNRVQGLPMPDEEDF